MSRSNPDGPLNISQLVEKLHSARDSVAYCADKHHYKRHHPERSDLDTIFDDLIDWARARQPKAELTALVKAASDPALQPGDLIVVNGIPATVRQITFYPPHEHDDSGLPQHQAATEIVTGTGSEWFPLAPQA